MTKARNARDESGIAMITAIIMISVIAGLTTVVLANGSHSDRSSQRGRNWTVALQTADSGVQRTIAYMQGSHGVPPAAFSGTTADGTYETRVRSLGRHRYEIVSTSVVGAGAGMATSRAVTVVIGPPKSFRYALFSFTDVDTKNNNQIDGDVWANGNVTVQGGDTVTGSATAATGWVMLNNGSTITGDVVTGGYNTSNNRAIDVSTNAHIGGTAKAKTTAPDCVIDDPTHQHYNVNVVGSISGAVSTWGSKTGGGSTGPFTPGVCVFAPAIQPIPQFIYNPANYDPAPVEFATPTAFNTWLSTHKTDLSGTYYIHGGGASDPVDLNGITISADTTIIAESAPIDAFGGSGVDDARPNEDKVLVLVSYYTPAPGTACTNNGGNPADCSIGIKNNFEPEGNNFHTATLLYAPNGPVAFKNGTQFDGAVYGNSIVLKNNLDVTYDPRVEQMIGAGPVTLQTESWRETT